MGIRRFYGAMVAIEAIATALVLVLVACSGLAAAGDKNERPTKAAGASAMDRQKASMDAKGLLLIKAAEQGDPEGVRRLLSEGADVNAKDREGLTALMMAVDQGNLELVKLLLDAGADVNAGNTHPLNFPVEGDGYIGDGALFVITALARAVARGNQEIAKLLVDKGADVNALSYQDYTTLMTAVRQGNLEITKLLIDAGADVNAHTSSGSALLEAVLQGNPELVRLLIDRGADVNARGYRGYTALMGAALNGNLEVAKVLIHAGADINAKTAADEDSREDVEKDPMEKFLSEIASTDHVDTGETALIEAARGGNLEVVKLLIDQGADVNATTKDGSTALSEAMSQGNLEVVIYLKARGAK